MKIHSLLFSLLIERPSYLLTYVLIIFVTCTHVPPWLRHWFQFKFEIIINNVLLQWWTKDRQPDRYQDDRVITTRTPRLHTKTARALIVPDSWTAAAVVTERRQHPSVEDQHTASCVADTKDDWPAV